jgi:hypothetical protein
MPFKQWENIKCCQKLGKSDSILFQTMVKKPRDTVLCYVAQTFCTRQSDSLEDEHTGGLRSLGTQCCVMWRKRFAQGRATVWKMISILVDRELSEQNSRSNKLQFWCMVSFPKGRWSHSSSRDGHRTCHRFLFDVMNVSHLCGLVVRVPAYRSKGPGLDSRHYKIVWVVDLKRGPLSLMRITVELLEWKVVAPV